MNLQTNLKKYFNYDSFQEGQETIIRDVLRGEDVLGVLKTGSGKSLCYQLPALMLPGLTIVVSPLIALMIDQMKETRAFHIRQVTAIHSMQSWTERKDILERLHQFKLIFISPEMLQQDSLRSYLNKITVSLFVIDEAHCISQWGYDFRPDYLRLSSVIKALNSPPILALTGTATPEIQDDIIKHLNRPQMKRHIYSMDRHNISLLIQKCNDENDKKQILLELIEMVKQSTVIYFSSRKIAEEIAHHIQTNLPNRTVAYYHGGMDAEDRLKIQQQFVNDQIDIICSTSAFGMGINKKNIRFIVHYHLPTQIEAYIQEIGRAGRDGEESASILLYKEGDERLPISIIENEIPTKEEISFTFTQLNRLFEENKKIPKNENDVEDVFQLDSTKWRLLYYQLELFNVINQDDIVYDEERWRVAFREILKFCTLRYQLKLRNITELKKWIHAKSCLRDALYQRFEQPIRKRENQCCSNCGFSFTTWLKDDSSENFIVKYNTWQEKLAHILSVGGTHETSRNN